MRMREGEREKEKRQENRENRRVRERERERERKDSWPLCVKPGAPASACRIRREIKSGSKYPRNESASLRERERERTKGWEKTLQKKKKKKKRFAARAHGQSCRTRGIALECTNATISREGDPVSGWKFALQSGIHLRHPLDSNRARRYTSVCPSFRRELRQRARRTCLSRGRCLTSEI